MQVTQPNYPHWTELTIDEKLDRLASLAHTQMMLIEKLRANTKIDNIPGYTVINTSPTLEFYDHLLGIFPSIRKQAAEG